jgi:diguanylate cyclase (GGDEF)-like protein
VSLKVKLVGYFLLLSLVPLAAATLGFHAVIKRSETRRVDVRLEAGLRAAVTGYRSELDRAGRRSIRLSRRADVQAALQRRSQSQLDEALVGEQDVRIVGRGIAAGVDHPLAGRVATRVQGPHGLLGTVIAMVPLDDAFIGRIRAGAGIEAGDLLALVHGGRLVSHLNESVALTPGQFRTVEVAGAHYRALEASPLTNPPGVSLAVLAPRKQIDSAIAMAERSLVLGLLASLLLVGLVAYVIGRSIVRSLSRIGGAAGDIAQGRLGVRVPVRGRDEFAELGRAFNTMAGELELRLEELTAERNRLREVTTSFGAALAATHDAEHLKRAIVEAAVEATSADGGLLVGPGGDLVEAGRTDSGSDRIELPLRAGAEDFGTVVLNGQTFTPEQREAASLLVAQSVIALENARLHQIVERQALSDDLTGLANRRHAEEHLAGEMLRAERFSAPIAVVLADLDDFKLINDRYGHPVGDAVLREFARTLRESVRDIDLAARWGGEEFIMILPGTDAQGAAHLASRVRAAFARRPVLGPDGTRIELSASFGVAAFPDLASAAELIAAADAALYAAKRAGKDRVVTAPAPTRRT